jgi:hypothetical protein
MKQCLACGMPIEDRELCADGDPEAEFCVFCVDEEGKTKSCNEVFESGIEFFMEATNIDRGFAEKIVRKNMNVLSYWDDKRTDILDGEEATDEEFEEILEALESEQ